MLYAMTSNGNVGHVVASQSTENDTVTTVCGKTIDAASLNMVADADVCKQCSGKVDLPEAAVEEKAPAQVEKPVADKATTDKVVDKSVEA